MLLNKNHIVYNGKDKTLLFVGKKIYIVKDEQLNKICFKDFIREIDICPDKTPEWKRYNILAAAKHLGFFG